MEESPFLTASADAEGLETRPLYGGAITMAYPRTYTDVSAFRAVPDHQEVWVEGKQGAGDDSVIVELLNLKDDVTTEDAAGWFFRDLAEASGAACATLASGSKISVADICPAVAEAMPRTEMACAVGCHDVAKFRDEDKGGDAARNKVMVYLANLRLHDVGTDMLVTMYRTVETGTLSSSHKVARAASESSDNAEENGVEEKAKSTTYPGLSQFVSMLRTLTIRDMGLFG